MNRVQLSRAYFSNTKKSQLWENVVLERMNSYISDVMESKTYNFLIQIRLH